MSAPEVENISHYYPEGWADLLSLGAEEDRNLVMPWHEQFGYPS